MVPMRRRPVVSRCRTAACAPPRLSTSTYGSATSSRGARPAPRALTAACTSGATWSRRAPTSSTPRPGRRAGSRWWRATRPATNHEHDERRAAVELAAHAPQQAGEVGVAEDAAGVLARRPRSCRTTPGRGSAAAPDVAEPLDGRLDLEAGRPADPGGAVEHAGRGRGRHAYQLGHVGEGRGSVGKGRIFGVGEGHAWALPSGVPGLGGVDRVGSSGSAPKNRIAGRLCQVSQASRILEIPAPLPSSPRARGAVKIRERNGTGLPCRVRPVLRSPQSRSGSAPKLKDPT